MDDSGQKFARDYSKQHCKVGIRSLAEISYMHLYLVDSSIFVFRAWFGPVLTNPAGEPNQALVGFLNGLD